MTVDSRVVLAGGVIDAATWRRLCPSAPAAAVVEMGDPALAMATALVVATAAPAAPLAFDDSTPADWDRRVLAHLRCHALWSAAAARADSSLALVNMHITGPDPWSLLVQEGLDQLTAVLAADERLVRLSAHAVVVDRLSVDAASPALRTVLLACVRGDSSLRGQSVDVRNDGVALRRPPTVRATATVLNPPWSSSTLSQALARLGVYGKRQ